jgi:hypothetical protein
MVLPSRLRLTTLGDLLGTLHRAGVRGTLELTEDVGRTHRVHVIDGRVVAVEFDGVAATLADVLRASRGVGDITLRHSLVRAITSKRLHGEVLVHDFRVSPAVVDAAVRRQMTARLARIEQLVDAHVRFRVTLPPPRGAVVHAPLGPSEFLAGRRRFRDRGQPASAPPPPRPSSDAPAASRRDALPSAWRVLGVSPGADATEIKRAYRRLAREYHPDLHPDATDPQRRHLAERFSAVTVAYRALVA